LIRHYPYNKISTSQDDSIRRTHFTTRLYDALFIRVDSEVSGVNSLPAKPDSLLLLIEAFRADVPNDNETNAAWEELKKASLIEERMMSLSEGYPAFNRIFADETIHLLSLIPANKPYEDLSSPVFTLLPNMPSPHRRSFSLHDKDTVTDSGAAAPVDGPSANAAASPQNASPN